MKTAYAQTKFAGPYDIRGYAAELGCSVSFPSEIQGIPSTEVGATCSACPWAIYESLFHVTKGELQS